MALFRVAALPAEPLVAAAYFYANVLPQLPADDVLTLAFAAADYRHRGWRLAMVQSLARTRAPRRVNAVCGGDAVALGAAAAFLESAPGVTGQYWPLATAGTDVID